MNDNFVLDTKLGNDSYFITDLELTQLRLMKNANFPWMILIPRRKNITELFDLSEDEQKLLICEISKISKICKQYFSADKVNIASFGNVVSQFHVHIIARFRSDIAWPNPIWLNLGDDINYSSNRVEQIKNDVVKLYKIQNWY